MVRKDAEPNGVFIPDATLGWLFGEIVAQSPVSTWIANKDGTCIYQNEANKKRFGIERDEEIIGKYNIFQDDEVIRQGFMPQVKRVFEEGGSTEFVIDYDFSRVKHVRPAHPTHRILRAFLFAITDASGKVQYVVVQHEDYTEKQQTKELLEESKARYQELVEEVSDWVWSIDVKGYYVYSSPASERTVGYTPEELIGKKASEFVLPVDRSHFTSAFKSAGKREAEVRSLVVGYLRKDGTTRYLETSARPIFDEKHKLTGFRGVSRDVTERVYAEQALQKSEQYYRLLIENSLDVVAVLKTDGIIRYASPSVERVLGYSPAELAGVIACELVHPEDVPLAERTLERAMKYSTRPVTVECRVRHKDGSWRVLESIACALPIETKTSGCVVNSRDITERKKADEALRRSEENFRSIFGYMPAAVFGYDRNAVIVQANRACEKLYGFPRSKLVGKSMFETIARPEDRQRTEEVIARVFAGEAVEGLEWQDLRAEGSPVYVLCNTTPVYNAEGEITMGLSLNIDITSQKLDEMRRAELEEHKREFYRRTILAATDGKLLVTERAYIQAIAGPAIASWNIKRGEDLRRVRLAVSDLAAAAGMEETRLYDLVLAVGEAITNAYKHAGKGRASLHKKDDSLICVVTDKGPGMETLSLPEVALAKGYSTAGSLGIGYKAMLAVADKLYLTTGPTGTTVAIEMKLRRQETPVAAHFPETWND